MNVFSRKIDDKLVCGLLIDDEKELEALYKLAAKSSAYRLSSFLGKKNNIHIRANSWLMSIYEILRKEHDFD